MANLISSFFQQWKYRKDIKKVKEEFHQHSTMKKHNNVIVVNSIPRSSVPLFKSNKIVALIAVKKNIDAYDDLSEDLKLDKEIAFLLLKNIEDKPDNLNKAHPDLKDDLDFVIPFIKKNGVCIDYISKRLQTNETIQWEAIKTTGIGLQYAPKSLTSNYDFILRTINQSAINAIKYASDDLKDNETLVSLAVMKQSSALAYASDRLKNDLNVLKKIANKSLYDFFYESSEDLQMDLSSIIIAPRILEYMFINDSFIVNDEKIDNKLVSKPDLYITSNHLLIALTDKHDDTYSLVLKNASSFETEDVPDFLRRFQLLLSYCCQQWSEKNLQDIQNNFSSKHKLRCILFSNMNEVVKLVFEKEKIRRSIEAIPLKQYCEEELEQSKLNITNDVKVIQKKNRKFDFH
jgi:hypothetical protein